MNRKIVIIAEMVKYTSQTNMYSNELDYSTVKITTDFIKTLQELEYEVVYYENPQKFIDNITLHKEDIVFSTLWGGKHSRNKRTFIPAICEAYDIMYVGADAYVQALCQNKYLTKLYLKNYHFSIPKAILISSESELDQIHSIDYLPCVIKPNDEACSVGISSESLAYTVDEVKAIASNLLKHYSPILIEEFIPGREISICCAGSKEKLDILEAIEIKIDGKEVGNNLWAFDNKRIGIGCSSRECITNDFSPLYLQEASDIFYNLGKVDCMRIDGKLYKDKFYVIELSPDCSLSAKCFMANAFLSRDTHIQVC